MDQKKNQTTFAYPVDHICGKISRHSKVIHACTASGKQTTYLQGERDLNAHPITPGEMGARDLFNRRQAAASARIKKTSESYAADMAAYREQLKGEQPVNGYRAYIWDLVKKQIPE